MNKISFNSVDQKSSPLELKVFKRSNKKDSVISNSSNPFGMTFKGKMIASDVFETSQEKEKVSIGGKIKNANIAFCAAVSNRFNATKDIFSRVAESIKANTSRVIATTKHFEKNINELMKADVIKKVIESYNTIRNPHMHKKLEVLKKDFEMLDNILTSKPAIIA